MRIREIWRNFKNRFVKASNEHKDKQRLEWAKARLSVYRLKDQESFLDWLDSQVFDNFEFLRVEARKGSAYGIGYYSGAMEEAEFISRQIRNSEEYVIKMEKKLGEKTR